MKETAFEFDHKNKLLEMSYANDNYRLIHGMRDNKVCVIFFSGNGLYYPDTEESFRREVLYKDRYEWRSVASIMCDYVERIILVRDVRKSWYVCGINQKYDSIDKMIFLLKELTKGYTVFTYGNSAGGYMAILGGLLLHAKRIYNWGGQTDLYNRKSILYQTKFTEESIQDPERNKYFVIKNYMADNQIPVFSFYAGRNKNDLTDMENLIGISNAYNFLYDSDQHGQGFEREVYINLLWADTEALASISKEYEGKLINADILGKKISNLADKNIRYYENKKEKKLHVLLRHKLSNIKKSIKDETRKFSN